MPRKPPKKRAATGHPKGPQTKKKRSTEPSDGRLPKAIAPMSGRVSPSTVDSGGPQPIHCKLTLNDEHIGFLIMNDQDATFPDVRAAIRKEIDPETLPGGGWKFVVPSLGPLGPRQEQSLGPVASFYEKAFEARLGNGTVEKPFALSLMASRLSSS